MSFDITLFEAIHDVAGKSGALDAAAIFFARLFPLLMVAGFLVFLILEPNWKVRFQKFALVLISAILSRWIIGETIRFFYPRIRPALALDFEPLIALPQSPSFPSGHAAIFFALGMAVFLVNRRWGIAFLIGACLMGVARVFVGVHWPSDIVAGAITGIISAFVARTIFLKPKSPAKPDPALPG